MSIDKLDYEIVASVAIDPGISLISIKHLLTESASDDTIERHVYKLCARKLIRFSKGVLLYPLKAGKDALEEARYEHF